MGNKTKCVKDNTKKYATRPSPPFPANKCKGKTKKGNNGKMFKSKPSGNGIYKWIAVVSASSTKTKTKKTKTKKTKTKRRKSKKAEPVSEKKTLFSFF